LLVALVGRGHPLKQKKELEGEMNKQKNNMDKIKKGMIKVSDWLRSSPVCPMILQASYRTGLIALRIDGAL
jgi:hypothetical protein